jgi:hypothetical protein
MERSCAGRYGNFEKGIKAMKDELAELRIRKRIFQPIFNFDFCVEEEQLCFIALDHIFDFDPCDRDKQRLIDSMNRIEKCLREEKKITLNLFEMGLIITGFVKMCEYLNESSMHSVEGILKKFLKFLKENISDREMKSFEEYLLEQKSKVSLSK